MKPFSLLVLSLLLLALIGTTTELSTHTSLRAHISTRTAARHQSAVKLGSSTMQGTGESSASEQSATPPASAASTVSASGSVHYGGSKHQQSHHHSHLTSESASEHLNASLVPLKLPKAQPRFFAERLPQWATQLPVFPFEPFGQQYPGTYPLMQQYLVALQRANMDYSFLPPTVAYPPGVVSPGSVTGLSTFAYDGLTTAPFRSAWDNTINPSLQFDLMDPFTFPLPGSFGGLSPPISYSDYIPMATPIGTGKVGKASAGSAAGSGSA